jgi:hypothetical protein
VALFPAEFAVGKIEFCPRPLNAAEVRIFVAIGEII